MKDYLLYAVCIYTLTYQTYAHQVFINPDLLEKENIGGGGYEEYLSYEKEGYEKIEWYKFEPERFPILVCIDPLLSKRKRKKIGMIFGKAALLLLVVQDSVLKNKEK